MKSASDGAKLSLVVPNPKSFSQLVGPSAGLAPSAWNDTTTIKCYGINVVGLGIADTSSSPSLNPSLGDLLTPGGKACAYRGIIGGPFQFSGNTEVVVDLQVPSGAARVIQLIGITNSSYCDSRFLENDPNSTGPGAYELGRVATDIYADTVVSIPITYTYANSLTSRVDCGSASAATVLAVAFSAGLSGSYVNSTNASTFALSGTCSSAGGVVDIQQSGVSLTSANCSIGGTWSASANLVSIPDGNISLTAVHTDVNGGTVTSSPITLVKDTTPPSPASAFTLLTPGTSPGNVSAPIFQASGVASGDIVKLYADSTCVTVLASGTAAGSTISLTSSALTDGSYTFRTRSFDAAGNASACGSLTAAYTYDSIAPTLSVTSPAAGSYVNSTNMSAITVSGTCSESGSNVVFSGAVSGLTTCTGTSWSTTLDFSAAAQGAITLNVAHSDPAGNPATPAALGLIKDTTVPTVSILSPAANSFINAANQTAFTLSGNCSDSGSPVTVSGPTLMTPTCTSGNWTATMNMSGAPEGTVTVSVGHSDPAGNYATNASITLTKDTAVPVIAFSAPAPNAYINNANKAAFTVSGTCTENGTINLTGPVTTTATCTANVWSSTLDLSSVAIGEGSVVLNANQTDAAGNTATQVSRTFIKDTLPPSVVLSAPVGSEVFTPGQSVNIIWGASDTGGLPANPITIEYSPDNGTTFTAIAGALSNSGIYAWTVPAIGPNNTMRVKIVAVDVAGNTGVAGSPANFAIVGPPTKLVFSPVTAQAPSTLNVDSCYGPLQVQSMDANNFLSPVTGTSLPVTLNTATIVDFFMTPDCSGATISSANIPVNAPSSAAFYYRGISNSSGNISASGGALTTATRMITNSAAGSWATGTTISGMRTDHSTVWTGTQMISWGGLVASTPSNTGDRTNGPTNFGMTATTGAPVPRSNHSAVWTGSEMIIWGGLNGSAQNTGAKYDPVSNTWTATTPTAGMPAARYGHSAVWTGSDMIVWGGYAGTGTVLNTGGILSGAGAMGSSGTWGATATTGGISAPSPRAGHVAVWTGSEMLIWGGDNAAGTYFNTGGRYNPTTNTWTTLSTTGAPSPRTQAMGVWTGVELIVWGGYDGTTYKSDGARYNPANDTWIPISPIGAPRGRSLAGVVWTGLQMVIWGGNGAAGNPTYGAAYNPGNDTWESITNLSGPASGAVAPSMVWNGSQVLVSGGNGNSQPNVFMLTGF